MARSYRLAAKPGLARSGNFVRTKTRPVIVVNKKQTQVPQSVPKDQRPQKVTIKPPTKAPAPRKTRVVRAKNRGLSRQISSRAHDRRNKHQAQYTRSIQQLKNVGVGRFLIMIACGPSILETDLTKLKDHPFIDMMSINKPDPRLHPTKWWVFCDQSQYRRNRNTFDNYPGTVINAWSVRARHKNQILVRTKPNKGFSKDLIQGYHIGRSTTFANMQTAFWMNYDKIFIFGCDMAPTAGKQLHFYGTNPDVGPNMRVKRFAKEAEHYLEGAKQLTPQERMKFYFCSSYNQWPFIDYFKRMDHIEAPDKIIEMADALRQK